MQSNHTSATESLLYRHTVSETVGISFNIDLCVILTSSFFQKTLGGVDFSI